MADNTSIPIIVQGNSFSLAIPLQIYVIDGNSFTLEDYTPDPTDEVSIQLKGSRRNYTYTPTIDGNVANINLGGYELADNYAVVVSIVKANGQRLRSFRTDQFFIVESSDDLTQEDIVAGLEENVIYINAQAFIAGADGRGIQSILKTGTSGLVDTYTITYTDNTTSTFNVTNGANGQNGADGASIATIEKTSTSGLVDTYTITLTNGNTSTFEVTNGKDGVDLGLAEIVNDLTTGGATNVLSAEQGKVLNETKEDIDYQCESNTLADAIAEVPVENRKVGLVISFKNTDNLAVNRYKYMGKYYTVTDWLSTGAWLDLNNADKYNVYYFRLCPSIEGSVANASINTSGVVTTGSKNVTDYIAIPESGVAIGGAWLSRYVLYDSDKTKKSTAILYGGASFTYSATDSAYIRIEYVDKYPNWLFGYVKGTSSITPDSVPHVEVVENFENVADYNDNMWAKTTSPLVRLRKGEMLNLFTRGTDELSTTTYLNATIYDINQQATGTTILSTAKITMPVDGYATFGNATKPIYQTLKSCIISKSVARTRAEKRILVVGDSISVYTWDNTTNTDKKQGYPFFVATQGNHEISVTNQAVSGQTSAQQLSTLQGKDMSVYDAVTIFIGTNDYGYNIPVATFKDSLVSMVDYIETNNPTCKICLFTPIHRSSAWNGTTEIANATGAVLSDYCIAVKEVAQVYGLPVLDLWDECQCNFNITTYKTNYSSHESDANGDGLHPTNEAHKLFLYPLVREILKKILN